MVYLANFLSENLQEDLEVASILIKTEALVYDNLKSSGASTDLSGPLSGI
jgi:hypothetical protein